MGKLESMKEMLVNSLDLLVSSLVKLDLLEMSHFQEKLDYSLVMWESKTEMLGYSLVMLESMREMLENRKEMLGSKKEMLGCSLDS